MEIFLPSIGKKYQRVDKVDTLADFDKTKGYFTKSNSSAYVGTIEFDFVKSK